MAKSEKTPEELDYRHENRRFRLWRVIPALVLCALFLAAFLYIVET